MNPPGGSVRRGRRPGRSTVPAGGAVDELRACLLVGAPAPPATTLPDRLRRALAVAGAVGAPALPAVDAATDALDDLARRDRAVHVASAQARAVAGGLAALPVLAVAGIGALLGQPLWRFYLTPVGAAVGAVGGLLAAVGLVAARRLIRSVSHPRPPAPAVVVGVGVALPSWLLAGPVVAVAVGALVTWVRARRPAPTPPEPGIDEIADLVATALAGGIGHAAALRQVAAALPDHGRVLRTAALALELGQPPALPGALARVGDVLEASARWGAPAAPALRRLAADLRAQHLDHALAAAERLPALLAFPTALCLLPACVLLAGAPLLAAGLAAAGTGT